MTLTQLEYVVAVDTHGSFVAAAEKCFVTQPTLSMQIHKLEEELGVKLFDRSKQPVLATEIGKVIIEQARAVLFENDKIKEIVSAQNSNVNGLLKVGVIPTLAPYILPRFMNEFSKQYPDVQIQIWEYQTDTILDKLKKEQLDCGLLATPLNDHQIKETPLFYEPFVAYIANDSQLLSKKVLRPEELHMEELWLLNEGHCMYNQVLNLCGEKMRTVLKNRKFNYRTGSVETLKRMVDTNGGATILPELAIGDFNGEQMDMVRYFRTPEPVREISVVTHRLYAKKKLIDAFSKVILSIIPEKMQAGEKKRQVVSLLET